MNRHIPTITRVAAAWLATLQGKGLSSKSLLAYDCALKNLRRFLRSRGVHRADAVTPADLSAWQGHLTATGCQPSTIESFTLAIKRWFGWQVARTLLFTNPARALRTPKVPLPITRCPTEDVVRQLLASVKGRKPVALRDRAILEVAYAAGARLSEIAELELASVDLKGRTVRILGKGSKERIVPLTRIAVRALRVYLRKARPKLLNGHSGQKALFVGTRDGAAMQSPAFSAVIRKYASKVGHHFTFHDLRRAFATHMFARGAHPTALREMLGHVDFSHLDHYLKTGSADALRSIRNIRRFQ